MTILCVEGSQLGKEVGILRKGLLFFLLYSSDLGRLTR